MDAGGYAACFDHQQLALLCANSDRTIDRLGVENNKLKAENAKLTKLARWMYQVMDESCAVHYPYEPAPVSMQALMRAEKELQTLGIEVEG